MKEKETLNKFYKLCDITECSNAVCQWRVVVQHYREYKGSGFSGIQTTQDFKQAICNYSTYCSNQKVVLTGSIPNA